jgi:hypothetical protein
VGFAPARQQLLEKQQVRSTRSGVPHLPAKLRQPLAERRPYRALLRRWNGRADGSCRGAEVRIEHDDLRQA